MDDQNNLENSRKSYINELLNTYMSEVPKSEGSTPDEVQLIARSLTNLEERLKVYLSSIPKDDGDERRQYIQGAERQENYLMQIFENRNKRNSGTGGPDIFIHQDILTKTLPLVLEDVNLDGTTIMDKLIQDEVMSDDERISIVQESTPRRRKEAFIGLMRGKLSLKSLRETFIPAVEVDHPEVATKIKKICDDMLDNPPSSPQCVVCSVKDAVQVHSLAQHLLKDNFITSGIYEELRSRNNSNSEKWSRLCETISDHSQIMAVLESHFPHFFNLLHQNDVNDMQCFCQKLEDDSSVSSNTNAYVDAGNYLLGDLDSVINGDSTYKKDAYGIGENRNQPTPSRMQSAHFTLYLDPSGPDYNLLIKPARPFSMYPTASSGPSTIQQRTQGNWLQTGIAPPPLPYPRLPQHSSHYSTFTPYLPKLPNFVWNGKDRSQTGEMVYTNPQPPIKEADPLTASLKPPTASTLKPLTASMLDGVPPQEQKLMLGERLFPIIETLDSDQTGKITGMLLEMDNSELLHMLKNHEALMSKVEEAKAVLEYHKAKETASMEKD